METSGGIRASLAGRYASALFDLARDERQIESVSSSLDTLKAALADSREFKALTTSPLIGRADAAKAIAAASDSLGLDPLTRRFLGVLANNGRLSQLDVASRRVVQALGNLIGICPACEAMMYRRVSLARIEQVRGKLEITLPQALPHIGESAEPTVNSDFG